MYHKIDNPRLSFSDDQKSILNMCEKHKMIFNDTLHLTFKYYTKNLKNCVCWVNEGPFSLKIMDVRLKSRNEEVCSAARFVINSHHYTCDPQSDSYGAVFGEMFQDHISVGAFISLVPNSNSTLPEMVWIQLTPEGSSLTTPVLNALYFLSILKHLKGNVFVVKT